MSTLVSRDAIMARRVPQIDGLRAMGMLMVYFFHIWEFGGSPTWKVSVLGMQTNLIGFLRNFGAGVDLFMVISGFCLFWPLCKSTDALQTWDCGRYFRHRVRRIVPPYYAAIGYTVLAPVLLVAIYRVLKIPANWQPVPSAWQLFTHFLFIHALFPSTWNGVTGAFWSLSLEAQFYVIFPLAVFGFRRSGVKVIWWMIVASVLARTVADVAIPSTAWSFIFSLSAAGRWMEFGFGMLTALAVAKHWREDRASSAWAGTAQIGGALVLYALAVEKVAPRVLSSVPVCELLLSAAFSLLIFALCTSRTPLVKVFGNRVSAWLGGISYSLYLVHQPTAWYLSEFFKKELHLRGSADLCLLATVGLAVVIGVAYPFYLIFEKPGLTMKPSRKKSEPATAGTLLTRKTEEPTVVSPFGGPDARCTAIQRLSAGSH